MMEEYLKSQIEEYVRYYTLDAFKNLRMTWPGMEILSNEKAVRLIQFSFEKAKLEGAQRICKQMSVNLKAARKICRNVAPRR